MRIGRLALELNERLARKAVTEVDKFEVVVVEVVVVEEVGRVIVCDCSCVCILAMLLPILPFFRPPTLSACNNPRVLRVRLTFTSTAFTSFPVTCLTDDLIIVFLSLSFKVFAPLRDILVIIFPCIFFPRLFIVLT